MSDLVLRLRAFHAEIVASDGGESEQMAMTREAADAIEALQVELDEARTLLVEAHEALTVARHAIDCDVEPQTFRIVDTAQAALCRWPQRPRQHGAHQVTRK